MLEHGAITHDKHIRSCILIRSWLSDIPLDDYYDVSNTYAPQPRRTAFMHNT
jgi:hypothetical protein